MKGGRGRRFGGVFLFAGLAGLVLAVAACGGGRSSSLPDVMTVAPTRLPSPTASGSPTFSDSEERRLLDEAQHASGMYGLAFACLFQGDFTSGGWSLYDIVRSLALSDTFTRPASGTLGITPEGNSYLSVYQSGYDGPAVARLRKIVSPGRVCYVPDEGGP